ncbi:MAG: protease SohB [Gammaproteobacteria bacterium]|nr:protease SohB [Gammaproteobacteria bacterium]
MEFLTDYGLFLAKALTTVIAIIVVVGVLIAQISRAKQMPREQLEITKLNEKYDDLAQTINTQVLSKDDLKSYCKEKKKQKKALKKGNSTQEKRSRVFVLTFDGDIKASAVSSLREEITAILTIASDNDEVVLRLQSPGGLVHAYGLASSQLIRIKKKSIPLTVAVDKVAASGGYMMACVADRIIAAPFAILGSIGVVAQIPNFNRLMKKHNVDMELVTAGKYKRTLTLFGENTKEARQKFKEEIEDTHLLFKEFISENRPSVDVEQVATGEHWFGTRAMEHKLVDALMTSDDYLLELSQKRDLYAIKYTTRKSLGAKISAAAEQALSKISGNQQSIYDNQKFM